MVFTETSVVEEQVGIGLPFQPVVALWPERYMHQPVAFLSGTTLLAEVARQI